MAKKVKIKSSILYNLFKNDSVNEGFFDNIDYINAEKNTTKKKDNTISGYKSVGRSVDATPEELAARRQKLWDDIINRKKANLESIYGKNNARSLSNNIFKISPRQMYDEFEAIVVDEETGQRHKEMIPAPIEVITLCEAVRDAAIVHPIYGPIVRRFNNPIVWTLNSAINTAASDGIRIAYNVIFAYQLIQKGKADLAAIKASGQKPSGSAILTIGKYWLFVYVHEAYHELYEHTLQAQRKPETENGKNHHMANVAMDAEINRDIENQIPQLKGCTAAANGVFDPNFPIETWDEIFDQYYYHNKPMPQSETPPGGEAGTPPPTPSGGNDASTPTPGGDNKNDQQMQDPSNQSGEQGESGQDGQGTEQNSGKSGQDNQSQSDNASENQDSQQGDTGDNQSGQQGEQGDNQSGQNGQPGMSEPNGDSEYDNAYNDELQNIADQMNGKKTNNTEPKKLSDKEISDIVQGMKDALANGMSMKDLIGNKSQGNPTSNGDSGQKIDEESARKLMNEIQQAGLEDLDGTSLNDALQELNDMTMSKTEQQAREQAQKDVKDAMDQMEQQAESGEMQSQDMQAGTGTSEIPTVTTSSKFGGSDMVTKEDLAKIAEQEGQPYTAAELTADRNKINDDYIKENKEALKQVSSELATKIENIKDKLKDVPIITNWKAKLKKFLKNQSKGEVEQIRSKRVMSQTWRQDRYMPYKDREKDQEYGAADVFYLIDNSGSMWGAGFGEGIFLQIFAEILGIEKACNIQRSALTYFSGDRTLPKDKIRLWDYKTKKNEILKKIPQNDRDQSGGTDIGGNIVAVTKLKKPYYYNTGQKHTLLIVFTDGEDDGQYNQIKNIPARIKKDLLFCLINTKSSILNIMSNLIKRSQVNSSNIICICTDKYKN